MYHPEPIPNIGHNKSTLPTVGFNKPRTFQVDEKQVRLFDIGGAAGFRDCWPDKIARAHAVIFVVDASNKDRFLEAKDELHKHLCNERFKGKPFLVFATKQDVKGSSSVEEVTAVLELEAGAFEGQKWRVLACRAPKTEQAEDVDRALKQGVVWLAMAVDEAWDELRERVAEETRVLDARLEQERKANAKAVAEKKKLQAKQSKAGVKKSSIVPITQEDTPLCTNMLTKDSKRVPCENVATTRNAQSGWQSVCDDCFAKISAAAKSQNGAKTTERCRDDDKAANELADNKEVSADSSAPATTQNRVKLKVGDACEFPIWQKGVVSQIGETGSVVITTPDGRAFEIPYCDIREVTENSNTIAIQGKGLRPALATDVSHDEEIAQPAQDTAIDNTDDIPELEAAKTEEGRTHQDEQKET